MNYFAPERRRLANGLPCFLWGQAICEPNIRPLADGGYEISLMLGSGFARWHSCLVEGDMELLAWLSAWRDDPEALIHHLWPEFEERPKAAAPKSAGKKEFSLSDLF